MSGRMEHPHAIMASGSLADSVRRPLIHMMVGLGVLLVSASVAAARPAHHARHHHRLHHRHHRHHVRASGFLALARFDHGPGLPEGKRMVMVAERYLGLRHSPDGFRGPWCGSFLGVIASKVGVEKPHDFRLARAWVHAGPRTRPQTGAIFVMPHHVGIIGKVEHGRALVISGNHGHRVGWGWYPLRRAIAFVRPT